jgi:hypothetical protein
MEIIASFVLGFALGILGTHFAYMVYFHIYLTAKFDALLDKAEKVPKSLARTYQWASLMTDVISYATRAVTPQPQTQSEPVRTVKRRTMAPPERIET